MAEGNDNLDKIVSCPQKKTIYTTKADHTMNFLQNNTVFNINSCNNVLVGSHNNIIMPGAAPSCSGGPRTNQYRSPPKPDRTALYESEEPLTTENLRAIGSKIGAQWRRLARILGLSEATLDGIAFDHTQQGLKEIIYQSLFIWSSQRGRSATFGVLAKAFKEIQWYDRVEDLAKILEEK